VLVGFLGTILIVEALVRLLPPDALPVRSIQNITLRKAAWLAKQSAPDVLFVGDSTGHRGIDVVAFSAKSGLSALNASITSGSPIIVRSMLEDVSWEPKRVVFTLSPMLLSDGWQAEPHEIEAMRFEERYTLIGAGPAVLSTAWATYRRRYLIKPSLKELLVGSALADVRDFGPRVGVEDAFGSVAVKQKKENFEDAAEKWASWTTAPPALGVRYAALETLAAKWKEHGIAVTYVLMPVHSTLRAVGEKDLEGWGFTSRAIEKLGGALLDCRAAVPDEAFYDSDHMQAGEQRADFARTLAVALSGQSDACTKGQVP
jgi:hypothetical protein